jgi:hypothetical protein
VLPALDQHQPGRDLRVGTDRLKSAKILVVHRASSIAESRGRSEQVEGAS